MTWADKDKIRKLIGLCVEEVPDYILDELISNSDIKVREDTALLANGVDLTGDIDGTNKEFRTPTFPIMDSNFDKVVDASDITVWSIIYDDDTGFPTKTELTVNSIDYFTGVLELSSAPSSDVDYVVAKYYYLTKLYSYDTLTLASNYYAAYLILLNLLGGMGAGFKGPGVSIDPRGQIRLANEFLSMYQEILRTQSATLFKKTTYQKKLETPSELLEERTE